MYIYIYIKSLYMCIYLELPCSTYFSRCPISKDFKSFLPKNIVLVKNRRYGDISWEKRRC